MHTTIRRHICVVAVAVYRSYLVSLSTLLQLAMPTLNKLKDLKKKEKKNN